MNKINMDNTEPDARAVLLSERIFAEESLLDLKSSCHCNDVDIVEVDDKGEQEDCNGDTGLDAIETLEDEEDEMAALRAELVCWTRRREMT